MGQKTRHDSLKHPRTTAAWVVFGENLNLTQAGDMMEVTEQHVRKILELADHGIAHGLGEPVPGKMCVEALVCFALGLPHGDSPPCVGSAVRAFKIRLNDSNWSSNEARAKGMRRIAIAQLGSDQIDQKEFAKLLAVDVIKQIVPIAMRAAASVCKDEAKKAAMLAAADECETHGTVKSARKARTAAYAAAYAAAAAAAYAYADAAAYAATAAAAAAATAADAYADAAAYAAIAAAADEILSLIADIGVNVLIKLGAAGTKWLALCD